MHDAVEIRPRGNVGQERGVLVFHGRPIGPVHVGVVEVIPVDAPRFVEDLHPLGAGFDADFDVRGGQAALARFDLAGSGYDPGVARPHQQLLGVVRHLELRGVCEERFLLSLGELIAFEFRRARGLAESAHGIGPEIVELPLRAGCEPVVVCCRHRQGDDALV